MAQGDVRTQEARLMRQVPTQAEVTLWRLLRDRGWRGHKVRRMVPVAGFMAPFLCHDLRAILDLRAGSLQTANDIARLAAFRAAGWRVLQVAEEDALTDPEAPLAQLLSLCAT